jgi:putative addiction module component (TIGR02574 family)
MPVALDLKSLGIDRLSVEDRLALIEELWESLSSEEAEIPLTQVQRDELDRRLADDRLRPEGAVSWEELEKSLDAICPR